MKKLVALMMALAMLLSVVSAVAEDAITLKIAHIGPTTGAAALYGLATLHGAEVAAAEINEAGGKYKVELINEDDEHNVEKVINAYNAALDAGAQMILGTTTSKPLRLLHRRHRGQGQRVPDLLHRPQPGQGFRAVHRRAQAGPEDRCDL